jgi:replicative DNA helicase
MSDSIHPFSAEAERAVLGSVLWPNQSERLLDLYTLKGLQASSFFVQANRTIYEVMQEIHAAGRPVDGVYLEEALKEKRLLDAVGGSEYVSGLQEAVPSPSYAEYYLEVVIDKALRRGIIASCQEIVSAAQDDENAESVRGIAEAKFAGLRSERTEMKTPKELLTTQIQRWELARTTGCAGTPTGFRMFDRYFGGLMDGAYYVLSGEPGTGKTTLARNLAENLVMRGIPAAFFTLEQTSEQIWGSVAARHAKQSVFHLNRGSRAADLGRVAQSACEVQSWPLYVDDTMHTPITLWSAARRMVSKFGCRFLVLDYLQQLMPDRKYGSQEEMTTAFSATCRQIAKVLRVPVLALCALSNEGKTRGSGMIGYDAWAHIRLTKAEDWSSNKLQVDVHFDKQRFGPPADDCKLTLIGDEQRFEEDDEHARELREMSVQDD